MSRGAAPRHGESFRNADADEAEPAGRQTLLQFTDCGVQAYRRRRHGPQGSAWMPLATDRHDIGVLGNAPAWVPPSCWRRAPSR